MISPRNIKLKKFLNYAIHKRLIRSFSKNTYTYNSFTKQTYVKE